MGSQNFAPVKEQMDVLKRRIVDLTTEEELVRKLERSLKTGKPLTVKVGFDPTAPDIHIGHTVLMTKMREFQDLGHHLIYIIGDFTASIGDPTGKSKTRPPLSREQILENAESYKSQALKVLDGSKLETRFNSEWLDGLGATGMIKLAARYTVARMLERRDFKERYEGGTPISVHEFLYPLAQAYDSVALKADVELGGSDQLFNLNVGRDIMPDYELEPQVIMTLPLLEGTDGVEKMSKSLGNYVGVTDEPADFFGKVMSISDDLMYRWYQLLIDEWAEGTAGLREQVEAGKAHPKDLKVSLAERLVERFHGADAAREGRAHFEQVFGRKELPDDIPEYVMPAGEEGIWLPKLLQDAGLTKGSGEGRRLIKGGGVRLDGEKVSDENAQVQPSGEVLIQLGKRRFLKVRFE